jgi:glycosyltransferase involved in cell wall biosynthesis
MTVLQLGPVPPPHGGVQTNLIAIRQRLRRYGIRTPVINLTRHRREPDDDVFYPRTAAEVVKLLLTTPADLLHLHIGGRLPARLLALCLVSTLIPRRRVVLTFHSGGYPSEGGARHATPWSIRGLILQRLDAVIAVNQDLAALLRALGVRPTRVRVIVPYAPYAPIARPADVVLPEAVSRFKASDRPLLTVVGGLEKEYDLPTPIEAMDAIRQEFPDAGLLIIGSGSIESEIRGLVTKSRHSAHIPICGDVPHAQTLKTVEVRRLPADDSL